MPLCRLVARRAHAFRVQSSSLRTSVNEFVTRFDPRAIRHVFGEQVIHRTNRYLNNHVEQDHRGIKQRYRPTGGLNTFNTATRVCRVFDEVRAFLRPQVWRNHRLSLTQRRSIHRERVTRLMELLAVA